MSTSDAPESKRGVAEESVHASGTKKPRGFVKWIVIGIVALLAIGGGIWFLLDSSKKRDVPDLIGETYASAETTLEGSGLGLRADPSELVERVSGEFVEIIAQAPEAGSRLYEGEIISVSVEPMEVTVPDLVGMTLEQAEKELVAAGLVKERVNSIPDELDDQAKGTVSMWKVTEQSVDPEKRVDAGTGVVLSLDIPDVEVPELKAETGTVSSLDSAQSSFETGAAGALSRALLQHSFVGKGFAPLSMSPAAGEAVPAFTEVKVTLGIPMPDIVAEKISASAAVTKLESMGFSNVTRAHDDDTVVVSQNIEAGTVIAADAEINLENKPKGYSYRVTGNGAVADITWSQPGSFNIQQANGTSLPWEKVFDPAMSGNGMLSAFMSDGGTEITCQVIKDGVVIKENTSTGPYAMVSCD